MNMTQREREIVLHSFQIKIKIPIQCNYDKYIKLKCSPLVAVLIYPLSYQILFYSVS